MLSKYCIVPNRSPKYYNGSIWESRRCGNFTIIAKTEHKSGIYFLCEFEDGAIVEADMTNITNGNIKSPNYKSVCGVGYMGMGEWQSKINSVTTKEYALWLHMIGRCYSKNKMQKSPSYKDVTVCDKWLCFQNFCEDIIFFEGYSLWKSNMGYELDKDILCEEKHICPKIYSLETCKFISKKENISEATSRKNLTGKTYLATSPKGETYEFTNQQEFANNNGLTSSLISACVNGRRSGTKGWTFKSKN